MSIGKYHSEELCVVKANALIYETKLLHKIINTKPDEFNAEVTARVDSMYALSLELEREINL